MSEFTTSRENGHKRPKGYAPWRPQRETQVLLTQVEAVLDEYQDRLPLTVRQVFYRLVGAYEYEKTERAYKRLGEHLVRARRARLLPFDAIRDDGVLVIAHAHYDSIADFHDETARRARNYRRDRQASQPAHLEVWCEAGGMLHQLDQVASKYSVPVYATGGFGSLTANYEVARRALQRDRPTVILHVGDFDPSGESIFESIITDAAAFVDADRTVLLPAVTGVRVALTSEQVEAYRLPTAPAKESDSRSAAWEGATCQLEALAPDDLAAIVEDAIIDHLEPLALGAQLAQERIDRGELLALPPGRDPGDPDA